MTLLGHFKELKFSLKAATSKRNRPSSERTSIDRTAAESQVRKTVPLPVLPSLCHPARTAAPDAGAMFNLSPWP